MTRAEIVAKMLCKSMVGIDTPATAPLNVEIVRVLRAVFGECACNSDSLEPIFTLRARDEFAPDLVEDWIIAVGAAVALARAGHGPAHDQPGSRAHPVTGRDLPETPKMRGARTIAVMMRAWQAKNGCKIPD